MPCSSRVGDVVLLCPGRIVYEHGAANDSPTFGPVMLTIFVNMMRIGNLIVLETVVVQAGILVAPVPETVPFRPGLGIDVD